MHLDRGFLVAKVTVPFLRHVRAGGRLLLYRRQVTVPLFRQVCSSPQKSSGGLRRGMYSRGTRRSVAAMCRRLCLVRIHHCSNELGVTSVRWLLGIVSARETEAGPISPASFAAQASKLDNAWCKRRRIIVMGIHFLASSLAYSLQWVPSSLDRALLPPTRTFRPK